MQGTTWGATLTDFDEAKGEFSISLLFPPLLPQCAELACHALFDNDVLKLTAYSSATGWDRVLATNVKAIFYSTLTFYSPISSFTC